MNNTLAFLLDAVFRMQRELWLTDGEHRSHREQYDRLRADFLQKHHHNRALVHQVNDLLDAAGFLLEYEGEVQFLLGLQIGQELRDINLVPKAPC